MAITNDWEAWQSANPDKRYRLSDTQKDYITWKGGRMYAGGKHVKGPYMTLDSGQSVHDAGRKNYYSQFGHGSPDAKDDYNAWVDPGLIGYLASYTYNVKGQHPSHAQGSDYAKKRYDQWVDNFEKYGHVVAPSSQWSGGYRSEGGHWKENTPWDSDEAYNAEHKARILGIHGDYSQQRQWSDERTAFQPPPEPEPIPEALPELLDVTGTEPATGGVSSGAGQATGDISSHPEFAGTIDQFRQQWASEQESSIADLKEQWGVQSQQELSDLETSLKSQFGDQAARQEAQYQSQIKDLSSAWGAERGDLYQELGGLQSQVGGLQTTLGEVQALNQTYSDTVQAFEEMKIRETERERLAARYGQAASPVNPQVTGVKTAKLRNQPGSRWYSPRNQFNRTGMRITNLNI